MIFFIAMDVQKGKAESGRDFDSATTITTFGRTIKDSIGIGNISNYYKVVLDNPGELKLVISSASDTALRVCLYDENKSRIFDEDCVTTDTAQKSKKTIVKNLEKGTYYIHFYSYYIYNMNPNGANGNYSFKPSYKKITTGDIEPNNNWETPQQVTLGKNYTGFISETDKMDIYSFEVKNDGMLNVNIVKEFAGEATIGVYGGNGLYSQQETITGESFQYSKEVKEGTFYISVSTQQGGNTGKYRFSINDEKMITSLSSSHSKEVLYIGESITISPKVAPTNATEGVTYSSSDSTVATVDKKGKVSALKEGKVTITLKSVYGGLTAKCVVTVKSIGVDEISLNETSRELIVGETLEIKTTILPENATNQKVEWTSDNEEIATVNAEGIITAVGEGVCVIIATTESNERRATLVITVKEEVPELVGTIHLDPSIMIKQGEFLYLEVTFSIEEAKEENLSWFSNNPTVVAVEKDGRITGMSPGTAVVVVTTPSGRKNYCTVMVRR